MSETIEKPEAEAVDLDRLVGQFVTCSLPCHDGLYMVFEVNPDRNGAKIQRPDEFRAHWVNAKHLSLPNDQTQP